MRNISLTLRGKPLLTQNSRELDESELGINVALGRQEVIHITSDSILIRDRPVVEKIVLGWKTLTPFVSGFMIEPQRESGP